MSTNDIVSKEYSKAVVEVLDILEILPRNEKEKIPKKLLLFFEKVASKDYEPKLDFSQNLDKIELMEKTKDILAMLYRNYWCSEEEKKEYDILIIQNEKRYQEELNQKYNVENLFKQHSKKIEENNDLPIIIEKEKIYKKVLNFIKKIIIKFKKV